MIYQCRGIMNLKMTFVTRKQNWNKEKSMAENFRIVTDKQKCEEERGREVSVGVKHATLNPPPPAPLHL